MFERALGFALERLNQAKSEKLLKDFALIGGLAVSRWSIPRATSDIDFAVCLLDSDISSLAEFLAGSYSLGEIKDPLRASLSFIASLEGGVVLPVQLIQFHKAWESIAFENVQEVRIDSLLIPIVDWKSLVLLKLYAGSALDLQDARNILEVVSPSEEVLEDIYRKAVSLRVSRKFKKIAGGTG